jgi:aryl-alcohol dehydrogenase-like predicted oxidoreductase
MVTYNPKQTEEEPVIDAARNEGVGVLVKKALASGHHPDPGIAIRFAASKAGVSSVIVGTTRASHLRANVVAQAEVSNKSF